MAQIELSSARTEEADPVQAAEDLMKKLSGKTPKLAILFAQRGLGLS